MRAETYVKSPEQIEIMRHAGRLVADCHRALAAFVVPGVTTTRLDQLAEEFLRSHGAEPSFKGYQGFPSTICVAVDDVVCHGIPGADPLRDGQIITIDIGAFYQGHHGDSAWTYPVGTISPTAQRLLEITQECLWQGIAAARPGARIGDIGHAIQTHAAAYPYGVIREVTGHGVGRRLHEPPNVPHVGTPGTGPRLEVGMAIAIEPMLTLGGWRIRLEPDGWTIRTVDASLCAQYEHTVAITADGPQVLTVSDPSPF